jgi:hypothetical protein
MSTLKPQLDKARGIFDWLQQGFDPHTLKELPRDSIVNDIDINRAIGSAIMAIDLLNARLARRALLPKSVGKSWTEEEEELLRSEFANGIDADKVAKAHSRTLRAIETRAVMLGLMKSNDRITDNAFREPARKKEKRK